MRSASGSVAITISALVSIALFTAISSAAGSSGLGDTTVGNSPLVTSCSGTFITLVKPTALSAAGTSITPAPCMGVYTIFRSCWRFIASGDTDSFITSLMKVVSISLPIILIRAGLPSNLILSTDLMRFTSAIIFLSCGANTCAPSSQ